MRARGHFDVTLVPQAQAEGVGDPSIGRMSIAKRFHGELDATSLGEMLVYRSEIKGSAGYVAMERVTGTLAGRHGHFTLQHSGSMARGVPGLMLTVVADSATEELMGLTGAMTIEIIDGQHDYQLDYQLPA